MDAETYLKVKQVAELAQVKQDTVRAWIESGRLAAIKLGLVKHGFDGRCSTPL